MKNDKKQRRVYKRITPRVIALHQAEQVLQGNGTKAVKTTDPEYIAPHARANRIVKKSNSINTVEYIDTALQQIAEPAMQRIADVVNSENEGLAYKASTYVVDHVRGKAVTRNISVTGSLNIQSVLD